MLALAALTVLSLLLMAGRVRRRGGFGRKASATLRSVYPIVLGLGGWFLGVLIVLTTMPGVPLDDQLLAVLSVGMPIGLGIYYAWVDRDRSARTRTAGLVALVTSIVGAAVGANLILLVLDIARERSARAVAAATPRPAAQPAEA
jgi:hypothetical protein